jgi:hypothetical protein
MSRRCSKGMRADAQWIARSHPRQRVLMWGSAFSDPFCSFVHVVWNALSKPSGYRRCNQLGEDGKLVKVPGSESHDVLTLAAAVGFALSDAERAPSSTACPSGMRWAGMNAAHVLSTTIRAPSTTVH